MKKAVVAFIAFFYLFTPLAASAHTTLISSDPVHDSTIQSWPDHITLTFGEPLQVLSGAQINKVNVTNANAESLEGATTVDGAVLTVKVRPNTVPGPVLVNYRIAAADGHVLDGEFSFTYKNSVTETPSTAPQPHHGTSSNFSLVATSTVLVIAGLLFGIFIYRRK
jgi:copper resistance protein C